MGGYREFETHHQPAGALILARLSFTLVVVALVTFSGCMASPHDLIARNEIDALRNQLDSNPDRASLRDTLDKTPLFFAVQYKRPEAMAALLEHGADVNAQDTTGMTPLHAAAMYGRREATEWLLAHGADPHTVDEFGDTPLHTAAVFGQGSVIKALKSAGIDLDARNAEGKTALMLAEAHGHERFADYLRKML